MSTGEWAALVASGAAVVVAITLVVLAVSVRRTLDEVRASIVATRREVSPLISDARAAVQEANSSLSKVDELLASAHAVTGTVDSASRFALSVFSSPVIKGAALASGVARGARSLKEHRKGGH